MLQDTSTVEQTQEALALRKLLAMGQREIDQGEVMPAREVVQRLRKSSPLLQGVDDPSISAAS